MSELELITKHSDIDENIEIYENSKGKDRDYYNKKISNGVKFIPYLQGGQLKFLPSRTFGYKGTKRKADEGKGVRGHGTYTSTEIDKVLGCKPFPNAHLDQAFLLFCYNIGQSPPKKERKFWHTPDALEYLKRKDIEDIENDTTLSVSQKVQLTTARIGQGKFRMQVLTLWGSKCAVTGCSEPSLLEAAHIKPWSESESEEKIDPYNGIILASHIHKLYDAGKLTIDDSGNISTKEINDDNLKALGLDELPRVKVPKMSKPYINHRNLA